MVKLWAHQAEAIPKAIALGYYGFLFEPGTGKTLTSIETLRGWYAAEGRILRTLIIGPPIVIENWAREIRAFSKCGGAVRPLVGTGKKRLALFRKHKDSPSIFISNYEALNMDDLRQEFFDWRPEVIVWDEMHKLKDPTAKRTKIAIKLSDLAPRRLGLTGTPVLNSPLDLFSQMRVLDGGLMFGRNYHVFKKTYFEDANAFVPKERHFPKWVVKPGALEEIETRLKACTSVVKKEDCLDLPPLVLQRVDVELSPAQRRHYEALKREFITYLGDKACVAELAITKALRMQQVVSGFMPLENMDGQETEIVSFKDNPRIDAFKEILEEIAHGHKVLVWCCFKENYRAVAKVCEGLRLGFREVHGAVTAPKKQAAIDAFNTDPAVRVLIGHPLSLGIGVNLVAASYSIFYSRNFSLEQDLQATARNYRGGSEVHEKITRIDLVAKDTIDETILEALANKQSVADAVLTGIKR